MALLIKNRKMPKHLHECPMRTDCPLVMDGCFLIKDGEKRHNNCPLIEVPNHGRLIDATELEASDAIIVGEDAWNMVHNAPTVLEAST